MTLYFIGYALSTIFAASLGDNFGRRKTFITTMIFQALSVLCLALLPSHQTSSLYMAYGLYFVIGFLSYIRICIGICYFLEFIPEKYQSTAATVFSISDCFTNIWLTIYYRYMSKNWIYVAYFNVLLSSSATLMSIIFVYESPKWLYDMKRFGECAKVLKSIARINGVNETP